MTAPAAPLLFVTTSPDKLREASEILAQPVEGASLELEELQTADLEVLVRHKAACAYRMLERPLIVEDTALGFTAWGGLPGPFIKHFLAWMELGALVAALAPAGDMAAQAASGVGYHDGHTVHFFEGRSAGRIVGPRGGGGFGWDPIFQPEGQQRTFAEMAANEKHRHSMRAKALHNLAAFLRGAPPQG